MGIILSALAAIFSSISLIMLLLILKKIESDRNQDIGKYIREGLSESREAVANESRRLREEVSGGQKAANETIVKTINGISKSQQDGLAIVETRLKTLVDSNEVHVRKLRETIEVLMKSIQAGNEQSIEKLQIALTKNISEMGKVQQENLTAVECRVKSISESNEIRMDKLRGTVEKQMNSLQESNEKKLDQMRETVDEKLQSTLEKRLGESFKLVSERLEAVQRGLGDMQNLATGVGDLKRMLTNVKTRGTWGEFQLGDILEQILTPDQFEKNVQPKLGYSGTVEYAIKLPGRTDLSTVWLPIDSKFPQEDYQRLIDATENSDVVAVKKSINSLLRTIEKSAKDISDKYIEPPNTTDFAVMFLPTEGLYSEVLRQPGLVSKLQQQYRVVIAGPTTLAALLNSLRMGFRTLAIEKHSSEVWTVLSAVKTEFVKFEKILKRVKKQLVIASNTIEDTSVRTRAMERTLRGVETLQTNESTEIFGIKVAENDDSGGEGAK